MKARQLLLTPLLFTPMMACDCHEFLVAAARVTVRIVAATCSDPTPTKSAPPAPAKPAPAPKPAPSKERTPRPPRPEYLFM